MEKRIRMGDVKNLFDKYGDLDIKVKTPYGFKKIQGCEVTEKNGEVYEIKTANNLCLKCSKKHRIKATNGHFIEVKDILPGQMIVTEFGKNEIIYVKNLNIRKDLIDIQVEDVEQYYSNGILSHNSTFTVDLISFLLFGKSQKPYTLGECFNKYTEAKEFMVSGCLKIEGEEYIIERVVTRAKKRTGGWGDGTQTVKYYRVINDTKEELFDTINESDEHSIKTNKIIKESIGSEKDFNMIISASGNDLDSLIDVGSTERGRLLSKWIGLFPLEEKDKLAKEAYKVFEKPLKSKIYTEADLVQDNNSQNESIQKFQSSLATVKQRIAELGILIKKEQEEKETLLLSKKQIDYSILKIDITTVNTTMARIKESAANKSSELELRKKELKEVENAVFSDEKYKELVELDKQYSIKINEIKNEINTLKMTNKNLLESEFCPTCKRKYDGIDNSKIILENETKINKLTKNGINIKDQLTSNKDLIINMDNQKIMFDKKMKLQNLIEIIPVQIENLRSQYREQMQLLKDFNDNKASIELNNKIDISLTNINAKLNALRIENDNKIRDVESLERSIIECNKIIAKNNILIDEIKDEFLKIKNWNVYLEMVGKNGISKMVLRKTLPIINSELSRILEDVCDFDIEVALTDKNEVIFKIIKDNVVSNLAGGSGFERTASALALRCVLGNISTMPRPNFITLDEVLGKVAKEFYENIRTLYSKVENNYQFILHITHIEEIKDWHRNNILITKNESNISSIQVTINDMNK